jgi:hypothetical protein
MNAAWKSNDAAWGFAATAVRFDAWLAANNIVLTKKQRYAADLILSSIIVTLGHGRASGKTFTLQAITRFLDCDDATARASRASEGATNT